MQHILGLVRRCVEDYNMIEAGETVAVGVSGGKDSLLTLTALARLRAFYPKPFRVEAITLETGMPGMDFSPVADYCAALDVPYTRISVPVYDIVFNERKEKNPCSLCAKLRRGSLHTALTERGIRKIALGHHYDDAVETLLMNLLFEGRIGCFQPVTYLDRTDITQIRPLLYCQEADIRRMAAKLALPVVKNTCPMDGHSRRQEVKELLAELEQRAYLRIAATYTTNQYILPPVYKRFLALRLPVSLWIHTLRDVDITQALLSHELDFAFIDSNTVFDDRLTVRPAFREPFLLLSPPDSHYPEEVDPASLDVAEELLVTWDPEFIRWHDRWFGTGARPLLYADTLQAADFLPPTEGRWVAAPAIAAASRIGKSARICHFTSPPPDRVNYLVTRAGEPLTPPALRFLQELKGHLLAQDNVQVYL